MPPVTPLWDFAVALYTRPGVADLCLALQDNHSVNVNVLLYARWLETQQLPLELSAAMACVGDWDIRYVQALRKLRRALKQEFAADLDQVAAVREHIKMAELRAEQQELLWLERLASGWKPSPDLRAGDNLRQYLESLQVPQTDIVASLQVFLQSND